MSKESAAKPAAGSQTLARGLAALQIVAASESGFTAAELAEELGVHRTIAHRILVTLAEPGFVVKGSDGRYRGGSGLYSLTRGAAFGFREAALPLLQRLADETQAACSILVRQGQEAIALLVVEPARLRFRVSFVEGARHPIDLAAGGIALRMNDVPTSHDPAGLVRAREQGYARSFGEVEPGAYGVATPITGKDSPVVMCVNLISHREDLIEGAIEPMLRAAVQLEALEA